MEAPTWFDWITLLAVALGPVAGVALANYLNRSSGKRDLQERIFTTLLAYRRINIHPNRVEALNVIEVVYKDSPDVLSKHNSYMSVVNTKPPEDEQGIKKWSNDVDDAYAKLLHSISNLLQIKMSEIDLMRGGYSPKGWGDIEDDQTAIRKMTLAALSYLIQNKSLPVHVINPEEVT